MANIDDKITVKNEGNGFDKIVKEHAMQTFVPFVLSFLGKKMRVVKRLPEKMQTTQERESDLLLIVQDEDGKKFILHIEFQTHPDPKMRFRLAEYHGILVRQYELPILHYVLHLGEEKLVKIEHLEPEFQFSSFENIRLLDIDAQDMLKSDIPSRVVMAILCNFGGENPEKVIQNIVLKLKRVCKSDSELKKYIKQLRFLAKNRNLRPLVIKNTYLMPIQIDITDDFLYIEGKERGKAEERAIGEQTAQERIKRGIIKALQVGKFNIKEIANIFEVSIAFVQRVKKEMTL